MLPATNRKPMNLIHGQTTDCRAAKKFMCVCFFAPDVEEIHRRGQPGSWLEKNSEATKVVDPDFNRGIFPNASVREGVEEITLRTGVAGMLRTFIDTTNVVDGQMGRTACG